MSSRPATTSPITPTGIAAFDVDGTLTQSDCVVPFLRQTAGTRSLSTRLLRDPLGVARAAARRDRDALKIAATAAAFSGIVEADLVEPARVFAERVHRRNLRPDTVARLEAHRDAGDTVVLVSASFEVYLQPLAELLGAHHVISTRLEVDGEGRYTGRLEGLNCRGPEKVRRLHEWLDTDHGGRPAVHVTAYGDSAGDRELLADADVAHWVGRRKPA